MLHRVVTTSLPSCLLKRPKIMCTFAYVFCICLTYVYTCCVMSACIVRMLLVVHLFTLYVYYVLHACICALVCLHVFLSLCVACLLYMRKILIYFCICTKASNLHRTYEGSWGSHNAGEFFLYLHRAIPSE